jgi:methylmalonyl-CoA mutase C-terminal domain/subunit
MQRKIRVLVAKPGLDGHDRGAKVVAAALRDAGMEVIYTGLHQTPEQVVEAAVQEDVDVVALSILSGAHMTLFPEVLELMRERGIGDKLLSGGGIIPAEDMETLARQGVGRLFGPGASTQDIAEYIRGWFVATHGADALAPRVRASAPRGASPQHAKSAPKPKRVAARKPAPAAEAIRIVAPKPAAPAKPARAKTRHATAKRVARRAAKRAGKAQRSTRPKRTAKRSSRARR